jgi:hypothetical protein
MTAYEILTISISTTFGVATVILMAIQAGRQK